MGVPSPPCRYDSNYAIRKMKGALTLFPHFNVGAAPNQLKQSPCNIDFRGDGKNLHIMLRSYSRGLCQFIGYSRGVELLDSVINFHNSPLALVTWLSRRGVSLIFWSQSPAIMDSAAAMPLDLGRPRLWARLPLSSSCFTFVGNRGSSEFWLNF